MRTSTGSLSGSWRGISRNCRYFSVMAAALKARASGRAPQIGEQRIDRGRFRLHHPESADVASKIVQQLRTPKTPGLSDMLFDEPAQMLHMDSHAFGRDPVNIDQLMVVAIDEIALHVEHVGESSGEAGPEIDPGATEDAYHSARHVLAAVVPGALD